MFKKREMNRFSAAGSWVSSGLPAASRAWNERLGLTPKGDLSSRTTQPIVWQGSGWCFYIDFHVETFSSPSEG
ncbi:hypothetical protein [Geobacillus sp. C56-T2]|uniref:hypothetical protein n=1 Tax=Geobacillus sp. C56-T2 TaxID=600773 RepID=UPI0011A0F687|nr:hypothetical protein [Geobacillus sp. C56-T2]NNV07221.1 hypothetical protein [Geobacillus sp. MMMUD3]TWG30515.1 hypothetical protein GC56T2_1665 [Geobacillus sp. C56-T2]